MYALTAQMRHNRPFQSVESIQFLRRRFQHGFTHNPTVTGHDTSLTHGFAFTDMTVRLKDCMGRTRTIPDEQIFDAIRALMVRGGDKAVAFSSVGRAIGLAPATLVQRYGSRERMVRSALLAAWDELDRRTAKVIADAPLTAKGAAQMLKALSASDVDEPDLALLAADFRDRATRERALVWRRGVETALAVRLGGGGRGQKAAAMLFAAWQGQMLWDGGGEKSFKIKDAVKRLNG